MSSAETPRVEGAAPLAGVRVLDLTRLFAGPFSGQLLGDFGAEVIHLERPRVGDVVRLSEPALRDRDGKRLPESAAYLSCNRNKKGLTVDLAAPEGQAIVRALIEVSDVVLENFRVGDLARYGLDYASAATINPGVIYCSITGFGQTGPDAERPGTDPVFQARSGWMSVTGWPDGEPGGGPLRTGVYAIDIFGGCFAAMGVLAALRERDRNGGRGQQIDLSLLDVALATASHQAQNTLVDGRQTGRVGGGLTGACPGGTFPCADGYIVAMPGGDQQVGAFFELLGLEALLKEPGLGDNVGRVRNRDRVDPPVFERTRRWKAAELAEALVARDVPAGLVADFPQALEDPQLVAREMVVEAAHPTAGAVRLLANPLRLSRTPLEAPRAPPTLGQHTDEILRDVLGLDEAKVADLKQRGVV